MRDKKPNGLSDRPHAPKPAQQSRKRCSINLRLRRPRRWLKNRTSTARTCPRAHVTFAVSVHDRNIQDANQLQVPPWGFSKQENINIQKLFRIGQFYQSCVASETGHHYSHQNYKNFSLHTLYVTRIVVVQRCWKCCPPILHHQHHKHNSTLFT